MSPLRKILGLGFAIMIDVTNGLLIALLVGKMYGYQPLTLFVYMLAAFFALLPDLDIGYQMLSKSKIDSEHRSPLHYPYLFLLVTIVLAGISSFWAIVFGMCLFTHFIHDSFDEWGIPWLAPVSSNTYSLLGKYAGKPYLFREWTPPELKARRPEPLDEYLETYFLQLSPTLIRSITYFIIVVGIVLLTGSIKF